MFPICYVAFASFLCKLWLGFSGLSIAELDMPLCLQLVFFKHDELSSSKAILWSRGSFLRALGLAARGMGRGLRQSSERGLRP